MRKKSLLLVLLVGVIMVFSFTKTSSNNKKDKVCNLLENTNKQQVNLFVTHGHCSLPFSGSVNNLKVNAPITKEKNPLEEMNISFEIDPNTFVACAGEELTSRVKTPGLFSGMNNEKIFFKTISVYTMGIDWYQINGKLSIKGGEKDVKFFATGIRNPKEIKSSMLILEGQFNLLDWGIDYDKIVTGKSDIHPAKWMHLNMKIDLS